MPTLREAAVAVAGRVIDVERTTDYESQKPNGGRVTVATGDGFARVKYSLEQFTELRPDFGHTVALLVRYGAWSGRNNGGETTCALIRPLTDQDVNGILGFMEAPVGK